MVETKLKSGYRSFIDLKYKPRDTDVLCQFKITPAKGYEFNDVASMVAGESSVGTWTDVKTMNPKIGKKLAPKVYYLDKENKRIRIAYPLDLFELGNLPCVMSSIGGNIYGMKSADGILWEDVRIPKKMLKSFKGPRYGIKGIRKYLKKDDENLTSQNFNKFKKRFLLTIKALKKAEKETGEKKVYLINCTAECEEMKRRIKFVEENGGNYIMLDILTLGWSALQTARNFTKLPIHAHRAGHAMFDRNPEHGMSMEIIAQWARMVGVDTLHIGTAYGKMTGDKNEVLHIEQEIENNFTPETKNNLEQKWYGTKPVFAVASGGVYPRIVDKIIDFMGKDVVIQAGGGIHGHPQGTIVGARAMRQAVDATMKKISLDEYAKTHPELKTALEYWSNVR
ncbi:MAG: ribulose-bisphosphate carboxylase large chain [archaeon GW2011_AR13]|nr:MAG: ribulose-bisphosphate carboxylase large chain [archaeon GW2011_AR13]VDD89236.1 RuBisCO long chain, Form III-b [uncultured archaeon]